MGELVVGFWNRRKEADPAPQVEWLRDRTCCPAWDVLILAEVKRSAADAFASLADHRASWVELEEASGGRNAHGILIVSRLPLDNAHRPVPEAVEPAVLASELRDHVGATGQDQPRPLLPERWLAADVVLGDGRRARVAGFHAPYAAGTDLASKAQNRLTKRLAYQQLDAWAGQRRDGSPLIVGMDGNNWNDWLEESDVAGEKHIRRRNKLLGLLDEAELFDAERAFHGPNPSHGLVDSFRAGLRAGRAVDSHGSRAAAEALPSRPLALTYRRRGDGDRMDRIYASARAEVLAAGVCHGSLDPAGLRRARKGEPLAPGSDHALVWAELAV